MSPLRSTMRRVKRPVLTGLTQPGAGGGGGNPQRAAVIAFFDAAQAGGVYDPSDLSTLWQDAAATVPVTADGDPVRRINDLSGNGFHLVAPSDAARPLYKTSGGLHWLQGDGSDDILSVTAAGITQSEGWYWACSAEITTTGGILTGVFSGASTRGAASSAAAANGIYQRSDGSVRTLAAGLRIATGTSFVAQLTSAFTVGNPFFAEARHEANTIYASNGVSTASAAADDNNTAANGFISMLSGPAAKFFGGVCIRRVLDVDQRAAAKAWCDSLRGV